MGVFSYFQTNFSEIVKYLLEHIQLTAISVLMAILIGVPLGILISYVKKLNKPVLGVANVVQAIPSLALMGFLIPILGIGMPPAIFMVILYSLLPIVKNTYTGLESINPQTLEAARGIGMTKLQILTKVQIPLALPVIMAGVRISAVTAVGLMTLAAFIGAGGLGYLVFSGIRTVNNSQILAGAIPACILALLIDFIFSVIEKAVTPISLRSKNTHFSAKDFTAYRRQRKITFSIVAMVLVAIIGFIGFSSIKGDGKRIVIGSKDFTEQEIVSNMFADLVESHTDIKVDRKLSLGGTQIAFNALTSNEIDMYVEYTGTAFGNILGMEPISDVNKVYDTMKSEFSNKYNIEVLQPLGFNNTYALGVTKDFAKTHNLKTISDLSKISNNLIISPTIEFSNRADGMVGLVEAYNMKFKNMISIDGGARYTAIKNKKSDVIDVFSTDGLIKSFDLQVLEDDKNFFLPYYAVPIINKDTLEKYPELNEVLSLLNGLLTDEVMRELNYQVDELGKNPKNVANEFLTTQGLL